MRTVMAAAVVAVLVAAPVRVQERPTYRDPSRAIDDRVTDLLARMTLEEKFWQLFMLPGSLDDPSHDYSHGAFGLQIDTGPDASGATAAGGRGVAAAADVARAHAGRINAIQRFFVERTRLGIPIIPFDEAVHGLTRAGATTFPQAIAQAATFDRDLIARMSRAIAAETRTRGVRMVLSPVVNIADDVRWGRVEETYGEDPWLASELGREFVRAFESAGIVTTPKHFVANVGEGGRDSYPVHHSPRLLMERYFPPFVAAINAGARSIMTAYNSVDGAPATQNPWLLNEVLKRDWAFRGFVISDASATGGATVLHMTEPNTPTAAAHAWASGLDVVFQSQYGQQRSYLDAVQRGLVPIATVDAAVARVLRVKFELGLFEQPYVDVERAATANGAAEHLALARDVARASLVLLRNERATLPLGAGTAPVAVIGVDAEEARLGGYSGPGVAPMSIVEAVRQRVGAARVRYAPGPGRAVADVAVIPGPALAPAAGPTAAAASPAASTGTPAASTGPPPNGLRGEYYDNIRLEGAPRLTRVDSRMDFRWTLNSPGRGIPFDWYSVRWSGTLTVPAGGVRRLGVEGNDGYRLYLGGRLLIDNWVKRSFGRRMADVSLAAGSTHDIRLEYFESTGNARVRLVWDAGVEDQSDRLIDEAVAAATDARAAVVVAGVEEGEFRDRAFLSLPGRQEELIRRVAATGTPTVVVLVGGSAVTMATWIEQVGAVLHAWYPGEQGGLAVTDVLFGNANPSGRLPITFPMSEGQLPLSYNHKPTGRGDDYVDSTGMALFPFGHGLSYTTFEYSDLVITPAEMGPDATATVRCTVRNTGPLAGDEVVQLYVRDVLGSLARPVMELRGFQRVRLAPGESRQLEFPLGPVHLRMLDERMQWVVEPGTFRILIGASSEDIRLRGHLSVK